MPANPSIVRRSGFITIGAALVMTACTGDNGAASSATTVASTTTTTLPIRENDFRLRLGVFVPLTGEGSELGQPMLAAVTDTVETINDAGGVLGGEITIVESDEGAGAELTDLIDQGVDAVIGPASSITALSQLGSAVGPANGVVVCSPSATAMALDEFPDDSYLFRTAPSDSLQMAAIARQVQQTGATTVSVGYLDDPYGRELEDAFQVEIESRGLPVIASMGFSSDESDLSGTAQELLDGEPAVIVVLGSADDGGRLLTALDEASRGVAPQVVVNDALRDARTTIQALSPGFRNQLTGIAPLARGTTDAAPEGFFAAHAADCVNLIALAVTVAETDAPRSFRRNMASVSAEGSPCSSFVRCVELLQNGLNIDYNGMSGSVDLANSTGDPARATFESFGFDADGVETRSIEFVVP